MTYALVLGESGMGLAARAALSVARVGGDGVRAINQLHSAALSYQLAQERVGAHSERGLRMAVNRGACQWLLGQSAEVLRLCPA